MSDGPMTLAARICNISGLATLAAASEDLAQKAQTDALECAHWEAFDGAIQGLLALTASPEGQAALEQVERLAAGLDAALAKTQPLRDWAVPAPRIGCITFGTVLEGEVQCQYRYPDDLS